MYRFGPWHHLKCAYDVDCMVFYPIWPQSGPLGLQKAWGTGATGRRVCHFGKRCRNFLFGTAKTRKCHPDTPARAVLAGSRVAGTTSFWMTGILLYMYRRTRNGYTQTLFCMSRAHLYEQYGNDFAASWLDTHQFSVLLYYT